MVSKNNQGILWNKTNIQTNQLSSMTTNRGETVCLHCSISGLRGLNDFLLEISEWFCEAFNDSNLWYVNMFMEHRFFVVAETYTLYVCILLDVSWTCLKAIQDIFKIKKGCVLSNSSKDNTRIKARINNKTIHTYRSNFSFPCFLSETNLLETWKATRKEATSVSRSICRLPSRVF